MTDLKQVKVDNWGIFFLQRLQQFFNRTDFCDLTLQFENNVQLKVHRLVMNACTEYFQLLENSCDVVDDCLMMPIDLQPDVVVPIVNFMYTGQLEFKMSRFDKLYATAKLMNMTVLTKLLDAQKVPVSPLPKPLNKKGHVGPITWNLQGKKIVAKTMDPDLPVPLPGRKLPVWKRKNAPGNIFRSESSFIPETVLPYKPIHSKPVDDTPRPTRFEWPEDDVPTSVVSSFDDISYGSKPLVTSVKDEPVSVSSVFEEIKRTAQTLKRPLPEINREPNRVNLQDVKEYVQEHRLRADYIMKNDESAAEDSNDDDYQFEIENDGDSELIYSGDESSNKSILKPATDDGATPAKKVRFSLEGKENANTKSAKKVIEAKVKTMSPKEDHTKLISEILKKYPHLVKKNANIKLKIMQKHLSKLDSEQTSKSKQVSYVVRQDSKNTNLDTNNLNKSEKNTSYNCTTCNIPNEYLELRTYAEYHEHLVEYHPEKIDCRVCPQCGFKCAQPNILTYHLYVKHGIEPGAAKKFPKCDSCDFIAFNSSALKRHMADTHRLEFKCNDCNEISSTYINFIKHSHQTNHNQALSFDCQYCHKKFLRTSNVITHMRAHHTEEFKKEGMDEINDETADDIQILSDIKINSSGHSENLSLHDKDEMDIDNIETNAQVIGPSSEAEALNNVASGIAASLGLVDTIVVLDENQFVLHSTEEIAQTTNCDKQFLIPDMAPELNSEIPQTIALTVSENNTIMTQTNIISNAPMTSTDELVMVLTDHDYSDGNNPIITPENSNIVVLYSHPVEGQPTQYISQEGNILLNSQTGVIEMAGHKLQLTDSEVSQINKGLDLKAEPEESIEMIQQEINKQLQLKTDDSNTTENTEIMVVSDAESVTEMETQCEVIEEVENTGKEIFETTKPLDDDDTAMETENREINAEISNEIPKSPQIQTDNDNKKSMDVDVCPENNTLNPDDQNENKDTVIPIVEASEDENVESVEKTSFAFNGRESPKLVNSPTNAANESSITGQDDINKPTTEKDETNEAVPEQTKEESNSLEIINENNESIGEEMTENKTPTPSPTPTPASSEIQELDVSMESEKLPSEESLVLKMEEDVPEEISETIIENTTPTTSEVGTAVQDESPTNTQPISEESDQENTNIEIESTKVETNQEIDMIENIESNNEKNEKLEELKEESLSVDPVQEEEEATEKQIDTKITEVTENSGGVTETPQQKDNVTALVSDWCDDDSALQANEVVQSTDTEPETSPNQIKSESETTTATSAATTASSASAASTRDECPKNETEIKLSNIKITKLLDDWDDGDTDSQNSVPQSAKNPINNLIDDWEDDD